VDTEALSPFGFADPLSWLELLEDQEAADAVIGMIAFGGCFGGGFRHSDVNKG
jgi:hypothetical protein